MMSQPAAHEIWKEGYRRLAERLADLVGLSMNQSCLLKVQALLVSQTTTCVAE